MPEATEVKKKELKPDSSGNVTLSSADLKELINGAVSTALAQSSESSTQTAKLIAETLLEARKPYKSPEQEQNDETFRQSSQANRERIQQAIAREQDSCPHMQGCNALSEVQGDRTSIVLHQSDTGLIIGICTNCIKVFRSDNPLDVPFFRKPSGNRMSRAGQRIFQNPVEAQKAGFLQST